MRNHVVIVVQNLPVPLDRRVWLESTSLSAAGYDVSVVAHADHGQQLREQIDGIDVWRYPKPPEARNVMGYILEFAYCWLWTLWLVLKIWRLRPFQVIHACNPPDTFWLIARMLRHRGVRFVFDQHDLCPEMFVAKGGKAGGVLWRILKWLELRSFRSADVVIAPNESHATIATERGGVAGDSIFVVRSGPDTTRLRVLEPDASLREDDTSLVGYLGEMCEQDGVDHLIRAVREIVDVERRTDVRFVLVGGGPALEDLKGLADKLGVSEFVTFTGRVSDADLCRILSTVDLCVDPDPLTAWSSQSTMNKIMEYMFFGKAIVAYPLHENMVSAGEAAVYARANDERDLAAKVLHLLDCPRERSRRGRLGAERVRRELMWDSSTDSLLQAYERVTTVRSKD